MNLEYDDTEVFSLLVCCCVTKISLTYVTQLKYWLLEVNTCLSLTASL
jgi:hypothetical protein